MPPCILISLFILNTGLINDNCNDAMIIFDGINQFDTYENTDSGYIIEGNCVYMGTMTKDAWYTYHSPYDGLVTISTCDTNSFDTSIIVYENNLGCDFLEYHACNGDAELQTECQPYHSEVQFIASKHSSYIIRVGGWDENSYGSGTINLVNEKQDIPCDCPTDLNEDNVTNVSDFLQIIDAWGAKNHPADIDNSGLVDVGDILMIFGSWGDCEIDYLLNNNFELPKEEPVVVTNGIFAVLWDPDFDHNSETEIMFEQFNAVRDDCINNLGMSDPPNPESCFYYNIYVHHGDQDGFPNGWANGQGTDSSSMPFLTLPAGLNTDPANTYHEGFHIFQYQANSPGFAYAGDSQWYIETSAQWYMSSNMPGYLNAFVEAGAILANPQLALWHSFSNQAPEDPTDWNYQVRQYGMHTLLYYLVDIRGVSPEIMTNGFYAGTDMLPQEYLYNQIGNENFRGYFADWAAQNTGGLDYLTPEQVERAIQEHKYYGDPKTSHPYIAEITDADIDNTWSFNPCETQEIKCFAPRGWAYNVIKIDNTATSTYTFTINGEPTGSENAESHFEGRIVTKTNEEVEYHTIDMNSSLTGTKSIFATSNTSEIYLVVVSVPEHFTSYQTYGYEVEITRSAAGP